MPQYKSKTNVVGVSIGRHPLGFIPGDTVITDEHIEDYGWDEKQVKDLIKRGVIVEVDENGNPINQPEAVNPALMMDLPRVSDSSDLPVAGRDPALQIDPVKPHLTGDENPMELPGAPGVDDAEAIELVNPTAADNEVRDDSGEVTRGRRSR